ncbi:MAG: FAD:protein FMN transferase, partial [Proteobacteria bacterium]|nr:FAD:protein FMN transferase [Pseudomonadota bacterium]
MRFLALLLICLSSVSVARADWYRFQEPVMGTLIQLELWADDERQAGRLMAKVMDEMQRIDYLMSHYKPDSELSLLNKSAAKDWVVVSKELFGLIDQSLQLSVLTGGAFDITYASVGYQYNFRLGKRPSKQQITTALPAVNYKNILLDRKHSRLRYAKPGVLIDLGGIAKGYAVDRGIKILAKAGITNAMIGLGGDSRILGDRRGRPWHLGVRHPRQRNAVVTRLPLSNRAISTSGDYEQYFERDGIRYHHIIDPRTGDSARASRSVTIVGPNATRTDALSTGLFVMGSKQAIKLIESLTGYEAVIVDDNG